MEAKAKPPPPTLLMKTMHMTLLTDPSDLQALLASAINLVSDNDVLKDHISNALNASLGA